ncbi:uncharacterized protein LOC105913772 [Setaria italica]|uniref:uncharacterized protein LOC105913772 n=1 Tax=Setaria italica TaxID=4555 RepID=UPI0006477D1E|nr:uncharacterized protein LOC105913772 [Setaria italica]
MDGGSDLNILYTKFLDAMGIKRSCLHPSAAPFHGIVPGKRAMPLRQIDLPVTFGTSSNYRKEILTFKKAYECDVECYEYAVAITCVEDPAIQLAESAEDPPSSKQSDTSFEATEGVKEVPLDPTSSDGWTVNR